ncbi:MAG: methyltransferase domain-containing protein [Saprospiraceae bacterium]
MSDYNQTYHSEIEETASESAFHVIRILNSMFKPKSIVDVGCGRGTWLNAWKQSGVEDILGIDGGHQDQTRLLISKEYFREFDLNKALVLDRKFELASCLEVVEHLDKNSSETIVQSLINLSDIIVFSAAVPKQGGFKHINEQWPSYWAKKFETQGFVFLDALRWKLLNEEKVAWWYRQNLFIVIKKELYERSYSHLLVYNPEFYLMHKFVYKASTSFTYKIYFFVQQFLYNNFHSFYHKILPTFRKMFKSK